MKDQKIKRQKIVERETNFSYEEKHDIAQKSNEQCCHCGKKVYFGYGATIEHFIPLSKGGTNRNLNLVMLCKDCNSKKGDFIYNPVDYLEYLNDEHLKDINNYFDSYINSFDFVNRDNLLACDCYKVLVSTSNSRQVWRKGTPLKAYVKQYVKRATLKDVDKLTEYYINYLKKYNCLDEEEAARLNILFWLNFGCIYYIEKNNEIKTLITVTVTKANGHILFRGERVKNYLNIDLFTYYSNDFSCTLSYNMVRQIPRWIEREQHLKQLPVKINILKNDELSADVVNPENILYDEGRFIEAFYVFYDIDEEEIPVLSKDEDVTNFFDKFAHLNKEKLDEWFKTHDSETYEWMVAEIALPESSSQEKEDALNGSTD